MSFILIVGSFPKLEQIQSCPAKSQHVKLKTSKSEKLWLPMTRQTLMPCLSVSEWTKKVWKKNISRE